MSELYEIFCGELKVQRGAAPRESECAAGSIAAGVGPPKPLEST